MNLIAHDSNVLIGCRLSLFTLPALSGGADSRSWLAFLPFPQATAARSVVFSLHIGTTHESCLLGARQCEDSSSSNHQQARPILARHRLSMAMFMVPSCWVHLPWGGRVRAHRRRPTSSVVARPHLATNLATNARVIYYRDRFAASMTSDPSACL